jgi:hypothetical protein
LLRRYWPPEGQIRLLTAALADLDTARQAWRQWKSENDLALADHAEVRLLAAVAGRIRDLEPGVPLDPRLEGMRRYIWAVNQVTLSATQPLLAALRAADLRVMLIKGAARLADDPRLAKERAARDIDALIHPDDWEHAVALIRDAGWRPSRGTAPLRANFTSHAIGLSGPNTRAGSEFDLHRFAMRQNQFRGQDLGLWERAHRASLQGVELLCPSVTDQAVIALSQATLFNRFPHPAHWALDVAAFLRGQQVDWGLLRHEVHARRIELFVASPLLLLQERLQCPVPEDVLADLTRPAGNAFRTEFRTRSSRYKPANQAEVTALRRVAATRALRFARTQHFSGERTLRGATLRFPSLGRDTQTEVPLPLGLHPCSRLRLEISFRAWHAGRHSQLRILSGKLELARVEVAPARRKTDGRNRYSAVVRIPTGLATLRGDGTILIETDRKLGVRDVILHFGPPRVETALTRLADDVGFRVKRWLAFTRRWARPASP